MSFSEGLAAKSFGERLTSIGVHPLSTPEGEIESSLETMCSSETKNIAEIVDAIKELSINAGAAHQLD